MIDIRLPNINAGTDAEQMAQLRSYLYQLVEQLNWALNSIVNANGSAVGTAAEPDDVSIFNSIKALIANSKDILSVYHDKLKISFDEDYVLEEDYADDQQQTEERIQDVENGLSYIPDLMYPVGSIYETTGTVLPFGDVFTWEFVRQYTVTKTDGDVTVTYDISVYTRTA